MRNMIIAVDGHAASGKGTLAKQLAQHFQYRYIDTGAMYRAITLFFLDNKIAFDQNEAVQKALQNISIVIHYNSTLQENETLLNNKNVDNEIRTSLVNAAVSQVASLESVRHFAVQQQQAMGIHKKIVMDGRDIGTKVFPHAEIKFFITAALSTRATRRYQEMKKKGIEATYNSVFDNLQQRDHLDSTRLINPLISASDAIHIDNTHMTIEEQFVYCLQCIEQAIKG